MSPVLSHDCLCESLISFQRTTYYTAVVFLKGSLTLNLCVITFCESKCRHRRTYGSSVQGQETLLKKTLFFILHLQKSSYV